jgi:hypothetical protein
MEIDPALLIIEVFVQFFIRIRPADVSIRPLDATVEGY